MEFRDLVRAVRERVASSVAIFLACVLTAIVVTLLTPKQYEARVTIYLLSQVPDANSSAAYQGGLLSAQRARSYAQLLTSVRLSQSVVDRLGLPESGQDLAESVTTDSEQDTILITANVTYTDPVMAAVIANTLADDFTRLVEELERPAIGSQPPAVAARVAEPALPPTQQSAPSWLVNLGLGVVLGALVTVGVALVRSRLDTSVKTPEELAEVANSVGLATIPVSESGDTYMAIEVSRQSSQAEAVRQLKTNLEFVGLDEPPRLLAVASSVAAEGKSTVACNLALALIAAGHSVALVDGDLRRPSVAEALGARTEVGLSSVLAGRISLEEALQSMRGGRLSVLASGKLPPNPSELLSSRAFVDVLRALRERFDFVVVDGPPALPVADGSIIASRADGVILVCRQGYTSRHAVAETAARLRGVDAVLLGTVLNMAPTKGPNQYTAYQSSYVAPDIPRRLNLDEDGVDAATEVQARPSPTAWGSGAHSDSPRRAPVPSPQRRARPPQ